MGHRSNADAIDQPCDGLDQDCVDLSPVDQTRAADMIDQNPIERLVYRWTARKTRWRDEIVYECQRDFRYVDCGNVE